MTRLFISLYLAITLGLVLINWSGELLWESFGESNTPASSQIEQSVSDMLKVYQNIYQSFLLTSDYRQAQTKLIKLLDDQPLPYTIEPLINYAFYQEQLDTLNANEPIFMYVSETKAEIYIPLGEQLILAMGPIPIAEAPLGQSVLVIVIKLFAYGLLALLILAWSYPVWRDLNTLKGYTQAIANGKLEIKNELKPHSIVFPLGLAFENMTRRIRELLDFQKQMMQAVSHDIRTPLARLKFSLAIDSESQMSKDNMLTDISEIEQLVEEMLTYGRLETAQPDLTIEQVNMYELTYNLIEKLNRNELGNKVKILLNCPESLNWECDGYLIERALQNLLTNAQRYANSTIQLNLQAHNGKLSISIIDDGCGIPEDQMERIFTPFARIDSSRNKKSGGFGLGLAIVNKIVQWHQGQITVMNNSENNHKTTGATFIISL